MAENTKIQWATHTMNFWTGCQEVSAACENCYARDQWAARAGRDFHERIQTTAANRRKPFKWNNEARENGVRAQVFTNSLADFFDNQAPQEWRDDACETMLHCLALDWLALTKRPQNALKMVPAHWLEYWPAHVWIGASAGDRTEFDRNVRHLRAVPAAIRFLSLEPLLEDLGEIDLTGIHWVIVGGESAAWAKARPCWVPSVRSVVHQCKRQCVPVFVKQLGTNVQDRNDAGFDGCGPTEWPDMDPFDIDTEPGPYRQDYQGAPCRIRLRDKKGGNPSEWPEDLRVRQTPGDGDGL